ncbi:hypothetical protein MBLNU459_g2135t1 [Dothideomycetes sp. NU459]
MNRFLNKKKTADDFNSSPLSPPQSSKRWRKAKKAQVEEKPQIDVAAALPPSDDFRTSLIMPNLSARFSMLREQDDPNSKLGKASDDSVLQPQRQSRLLDFGFTSNNLSDIAEVSSVYSSIRPPFARQRTDSYASEEGTDDASLNGSMMSRARHGEGNVLFGGRQKIYKIPYGAGSSAKSIGGGSEKNMGKVLYDDDVNMSAFQKWRAQERATTAVADTDETEEERTSTDSDMQVREGRDDEVKSNSHSAAHATKLGLSHPESASSHFNARSSDSTTTSGPSHGRTSTAATSVASQPAGPANTAPATLQNAASVPAVPGLERSLTKKRLYEQGLEKNMYDQQASVLTRLNSIQRQRAPTVTGAMSRPGLSHSRSIGNINERRHQPYALQPTSPPPMAISPALTNLAQPKQPRSDSSSPVPSWPQSPTSPIMSESEEYQTLQSALEPGDRGKATALGAFNKPAQRFDEQQYLQRQMQVQQPNDASSSRKNSIESTTQESRLARFDSGRQTSGSRDNQRSRSRSVSSKPDTNKAFAVFQNAVNQNRAVHGDSPQLDTHRTFFGDISASEDEEEEDDAASEYERHGNGYAPNNYNMVPGSGRFTPTALPSVSEHPALRREPLPLAEVDEEEEEEPILPIQPAMAMSPASSHEKMLPLKTDTAVPSRASSEYKELDSPTIGTQEALGGLIHQHLRNTSNQSSIYPPTRPSNSIHNYADRSSLPVRDTYNSDRNMNSSYSESAWDLDELDSYYGDTGTKSPVSPVDSVPPMRHPLAPVPSKGNISRPSTAKSDVSEGGPWQNEFRKQHTRDVSTATQAEREAFDNELAARQRAIQEKMKSIVESESRAPSPAPSASGALRAFGMLKTKPSHEVMPKDASSKAIKMLGLGAQNNTHVYEDAREDTPQMGNAWAPPAQWPLGPREQRSDGNLQMPRSRGNSEAGLRDGRLANSRTPSLQAAREQSRARSSSVTSRNRSHSRSGRARDEQSIEPSPMLPQGLAIRPSPGIGQQLTPSSDVQGRARSNSKPSSYFDARPPHPAFATTPNGRLTPSGTPSGVLTPASYSSAQELNFRPSYVATTSAKSSPGLSKAPIPHVPVGKPNGAVLRKKTVSKADISEPTLVSSTSNVDTIDLAPGVSLKNGMPPPAPAPPIPAVNPRRRKLFGLGRDRSSDELEEKDRYTAVINSPALSSTSSFSPRMGTTRSDKMGPEQPTQSGAEGRDYPRTVRSHESFDQGARFDAIGSPVLNQAGMF